MPSFSRSCTRKDAATQITATQNTKLSPKACSCWPEFSCDQDSNARIAHCVNLALHRTLCPLGTAPLCTDVSECRRYTDLRFFIYAVSGLAYRTVLWVPSSQLRSGVCHSSYYLENKFAPVRSNQVSHAKPFGECQCPCSNRVCNSSLCCRLVFKIQMTV